MFELLDSVSGVALVAAMTAGAFALGRYINRPSCDAFADDNFQGFVQSINEGYYRSSLGGKLLFSNKALARMNGYSSEADFLHAVQDIATQWYVEQSRREEFVALLAQKNSVENFVSQVHRRATGERIWVSENARLVCDDKGKPSHYEGTVREFSDTMRRLELENLYKKLSEQAPGALLQARWCPSNGFSIPYHSDGLKTMLGDLVDGLEHDASSLFKRLNPSDYSSFVASAQKSATELAPWVHEFRFERKTGEEIWVEINATPEREEGGACLWHGFLMDVTAKKIAEHRIHSLAFYDPLTELPNRRLMLDRIEQIAEQYDSQKLSSAVLFLDLDNFKILNDTCGHHLGDELLVEVAKRLRDRVGDRGLVARFGGDEFVVLLDNLGHNAQVSSRQAEILASNLLEVMSTPFVLSIGEFHLSCSIGISIVDERANSPVDILKNADTAMYEAKLTGKNCFCLFDERMKERLENSVNLMKDLRAAIGTNQLKLHFQMQVSGENEIVGAEALLRWDHPEKGPISPAQFIPAAEESGIIVELTDWLFEQAARTLEAWSANPALKNTSISINISAQQFHELSFEAKVRDLIEKYKIGRNRLVLEMTEHVLTGDLRQVSAVMSRLKKLGVKFSLDDFGTGYSSLSHLRELPFDEVKIDGSFVKDLEHNENDRAILNSILMMAKALGLSTVAEWVETDAQREFLVGKGCDILQGFLYGSALPIHAFEAAAALPLFAGTNDGPETVKLPEDARNVA